MSEWNECGFEELSVSNDGKDLHILFESNYNGAVYLSIPIEDVLKKINEKVK